MPNGEFGDVRYGWTAFQNRLVITDSADHELVAAPGANKRICISKISIANAHASTTTQVHLKSATTAIWTHSAPFKGGNEPKWPHPIKCVMNEALNCACDDAISTVYVSVSGYIEQGP